MKKVVIMEQIPRYDPSNIDPFSEKASLSSLFNETLPNLWIKSSHKSRIFIGSHNLECNGLTRHQTYGYPGSTFYDGIHLNGSGGRKAYTESVLNILNNAQITSCFLSKPRVPQPSFTLPIANRFSVLSSDQGNL